MSLGVEPNPSTIFPHSYSSKDDLILRIIFTMTAVTIKCHLLRVTFIIFLLI